MFILFSCSGRTENKDTAEVSQKGTLIAMPLINNNPVMKFSFGGIGMYMFQMNKPDTISPPSTIMLLGLYSTNNSYIVAMPAALFWGEDYFRLTAALMTARINNDFVYDYEGSDITLVYSELRLMYITELSMQFWKNIYVGLLYAGFLTNYKYNKGTEEENNFTQTLFEQLGIKDSYTSSLGLKISFDNRDYIYNPTTGYNLTLRALYFARWLGSENEYGNIVYDFKYYHTLVPKHVIAAMVSGGHSVGDVPFSGYQMYGMRNSLRGYPTGKYRAENMLALQAEYRWNFYNKWGAAVFAGVGTLWGGKDQNTEEVFERGLLPGAGIGIRFLLSEERNINARLDFAWGIDGNEGVYLGIMEAF